MKCPNDQTEMEKGVLKSSMMWSKESILTKMDKMITNTYVYAYHCPKCGKVELTTQIEG